VELDSTATRFDTQYYKDITRGRGLLTSDQGLLSDARTKGAVYSNRGTEFLTNFGKAMVAMSQIEVLTGSAGEIRRHMFYVN
jgi:peroxidase